MRKFTNRNPVSSENVANRRTIELKLNMEIRSNGQQPNGERFHFTNYLFNAIVVVCLH